MGTLIAIVLAIVLLVGVAPVIWSIISHIWSVISYYLKRMHQPPGVVVVRDIESEFPVHDIPRGNVIEELADLHEFATFCANIYHEADTEREPVPGWKLFERITPPDSPRWWKRRVRGLGCEVWLKKRAGSSNLALIVFRGTDFKELGDWVSNLRWFITFFVPFLWPFLWDQYAQTRALTPNVVRQVRGKFGPDTEIATAGHSLGGGLAEQAGCVSERIKLVYAFAPSFVTGEYSVSCKRRKTSQKGMRIYRVYEHGEILANFRLLLKAVNPLTCKDPKIVEVRYNVTSGSSIKQHSMRDFASRLRSFASCGPGA